MKKPHVFIASIAVALIMALTSVPAAFAASAPVSSKGPVFVLTPALESQARSFLTQYGVVGRSQERLIRHIYDGGIWDAMTGALPSSSKTSIEANYQVTIDRYADGSVAVSKLEQPSASQTFFNGSDAVSKLNQPSIIQPSPILSPMGVDSCSRSGIYYTNCNVNTWVGLIAMNFRVDYVINNPGYDSITRVYGAAWSVGGACSVTKTAFGVIKSTESAAGPARARLDIIATPCVITAVQQPLYLQLTVGSNTATESHG